MANAGIRNHRMNLCSALSVLLLLLLLIGACSTGEVYQGYIPSLDEANLQRLKTILDDGDPIQVLQDLDTLRRTFNEESEFQQRLADLEKQAVEMTTAGFEEALDARQYRDALVLYRSLSTMKADIPVEGVSEQSLLLSAAEKELEEGSATVGLMFFFRAAEKGDVPPDTLLRFGDVALDEANRQALANIVDMLDEAGEAIPEEYSAMVAEGRTAADMLAGTVTIWVNRGMVLERGVGYPERVIGSGFFIDRGGYIVTNYHVISSEVDPEYEGYSRLYVRLPDNPSLKIPATVVGWNRIFDIALLKVELEPDFVFMFEEGITGSPGDMIYAIGSPAGLERTITSGIVSARDRDLLQMGNAIQVDVPINQGNSGGPLVDKDGQLIGVVFAGIEQFEGVNFAIPSEWLVDIVPDLFLGGETLLPWIGAMGTRGREGLEVMYVLPGTPAHRAGLSAGDLITAVAGLRVEQMSDVHKIMLDLAPGTLIDVRWLRDGREMNGRFQLAERPHRPLEVALDRDVRENLLVPLYGMKAERSGTIGLEQNYIITRIYPGFSADEMGLSPNDPFSIRDWIVEEEDGYAAVRIRVKKIKAGFLESVIQLATYLENAYFM